MCLVTWCAMLLIVSNSVWPHELKHARLPCPSPFPGACSNSCPLSRWCLPTISSSVVPFSCLKSFPASGSFPMSQPISCGQSIGASTSASVLPMNDYLNTSCKKFPVLNPGGNYKTHKTWKKTQALYISSSLDLFRVSDLPFVSLELGLRHLMYENQKNRACIAIDSWRIETLSFLYCFLHGCQINMRTQYMFVEWVCGKQFLA